MTLQAAEEFRIPFGKYKGRPLSEIAEHDVLYLDWLNGLSDLSVRLMAAVSLVCASRSKQIDAAIDAKDGD